jgi:hypothetical protein
MSRKKTDVTVKQTDVTMIVCEENDGQDNRTEKTGCHGENIGCHGGKNRMSRTLRIGSPSKYATTNQGAEDTAGGHLPGRCGPFSLEIAY